MSRYTFLFGCTVPLYNVEVTPSSSLQFPDIFGNEWRDVLYFTQKCYAQCYGLNKRLEEMGQVGLKLINKKFAEKQFSASAAAKEQYHAFVQKLLTTSLDQLSNKELYNLFEQHFRIFQLLISFFKYSRPEFFTEIEKNFKELLSKKALSHQIDEYFQLLTTPHEFDEINIEEIAWVDFLHNFSHPSSKNFLEYTHKFPFLFSNVKNETEAIQYLEDRFTEWKKNKWEKIHNHKSMLEERKYNLLQKQKEIYAQYPDSEIEYFSWLYQQTALDRLRLKVWGGFTFICLPLIREIVKRIGVSFDDFWDTYTSEDVRKALLENIFLSSGEIESRRKCSLFWLKDRDLLFIHGEHAENTLKQEVPEAFKIQDVKEFTGRVACQGYAQGKVSVVNVADLQSLARDIKKFNKGDILVTQMTQPNMVLLCEQAAAIITDEGGMTSHAAVIAREFKIPCIVGAEIATKVLHDGDLVEVDADKGVVRKIQA